MAYVPDVDNAAEPIISRPSGSAAEEFRRVKERIAVLGGIGTFWNPDDKSSQITLSLGNLLATKAAPDGSDAGVRAFTGKNSGQWYWELTVQSISASMYLGIGTLLASLSSSLGADINGFAYRSDGQKVNNGVAAAYGASYTAGDVISVAFDATAGTLTFFKNNVSQGIAYSGLTGTKFPIASLVNTGNAVLANFGNSAFVYAPPPGFSGFTAATAAASVPFFVRQFFPELS